MLLDPEDALEDEGLDCVAISAPDPEDELEDSSPDVMWSQGVPFVVAYLSSLLRGSAIDGGNLDRSVKALPGIGCKAH